MLHIPKKKEEVRVSLNEHPFDRKYDHFVITMVYFFLFTIL